MSFTDIFIRRPVLALVVSLLILLIGLRAMLGLPIRQYPKLSNTTITITTIYPGASPDLMQGFITTPMAQAVATAEGVDYLISSSVQGTSTITAYIILDFDPDKALTEVMAKVQQVKYLLPTGCARSRSSSRQRARPRRSCISAFRVTRYRAPRFRII